MKQISCNGKEVSIAVETKTRENGKENGRCGLDLSDDSILTKSTDKIYSNEVPEQSSYWYPTIRSLQSCGYRGLAVEVPRSGRLSEG